MLCDTYGKYRDHIHENTVAISSSPVRISNENQGWTQAERINGSGSLQSCESGDGGASQAYGMRCGMHPGADYIGVRSPAYDPGAGNGPEFVSKKVGLRAYANGVTLDFSRSGKPTDHTLIESLNARVRRVCLIQHWFLSLEGAQVKVEWWRELYHHERPYGQLEYKIPVEYTQAHLKNAIRVNSAAHALLAAVKILRPMEIGSVQSKNGSIAEPCCD